MNTSQHTSPVTLSTNTSRLGSVDVRWLIAEYSRQLKVDISRFVGDLHEISVFRCEDTGYSYYHPFSVAGDASFYEELQRYSWYYMDWKWEHETAKRHVVPDMHVLEIGCGEGGFLQGLQASSVGLELNEKAAVTARSKGVAVLTETIQEHARRHKGEYDCVCCFQVLEHIAQVHEFITSSIEVLEPGGILVLSVPNNDSFIFKEFGPILNYPPHHMGLWSVNSLLGLQKIAAIRVEAVFLEPLQPYHFGYGADFLAGRLSGPHSSIVRRAAAKLERILLRELPPLQQMAGASTSALAPYLPGHSALMIFGKTA